MLRGKLNSINLLGMGHGSDLRRYKIDPLLLNMKNFFNRKGREGMVVCNNGVQYVVHPLLLASLGDTPAQGWIAGGKQSDRANCPCRRCTVTKEIINTLLRENPDLLRTKEQHNAFCDQLDACANRAERDAVSFSCGINERALLSEVNDFDISQCMLFDVMHTLLEGIDKEDFRQCLKHLINLRLCTLDAINHFIAKMTYTKLLEKPSKITNDHLQTGIRQTSSQVYALSVVIPLMLEEFGADCNDNGIFENTLRVIKLTHIFLSFVVHDVDLLYMEDEIEKYLSWYTEIYCSDTHPMNIKRHSLIHIPSQIRAFGPCRCAWVMRFEALHQTMKDLTKEINNYINITLSLSNRFMFNRLAESNFYAPNYYSIYKVYITFTKSYNNDDILFLYSYI